MAARGKVRQRSSPRRKTARDAAEKLAKQKSGKGYLKVAVRKQRAKKAKTRSEPASSKARKPSGKFVKDIVTHSDSRWDLEKKWSSARGIDSDYYDGEGLDYRIAWAGQLKRSGIDTRRRLLPDGVAWSDNAVSAELRRKLNYQFSRMLKQEPADYHPGSDKQVRDLVHPSLYPYVKGLSKTEPKKLAGLPVKLTDPDTYYGDELDFWKRPYEESKFQWLPTPFSVNKKGAVSIEGYINNLDQQKYPGFYKCLEDLFATALPLFESVCQFAQDEHFYADTEKDIHYTIDMQGLPEKRPRLRLKGRELQVIPKVVEYEIKSGKGLEGVWHVEGMSHENILATAVYVLKRDKALAGGDIGFKRAYTLPEAKEIFRGTDQYPPDAIYEAVGKGVIPNGTLSTPEGRLFVFPNSHIHKLSKMTATGSGKTAKRRVIVFWLIHPDAPIISTREVPKQQGIISKQKAKQIRLQLMRERKLHKQSLNPRSISLCEH